jgi:4-aminobutyrate aminotransferase-like enzyme/Ser/Thr protein kinase RdoA (MazF antagonist)
MLIQKENPGFDISGAKMLVDELYNIEAMQEPKLLPSYLDQNFLIRDMHDRKYVLKITNPSEERSVLELQNNAMAHLTKKGMGAEIQKVILSVNKNEIETITFANENYCVRLLQFLEGQTLVSIHPRKAELFSDIGRFLGQLDRALEDFEDKAAKRFMQWDPAQAEKIIGSNIQLFGESDKFDLINYYYQRFLKNTAPSLSALKKQVIHSDANDYNILVRPDKEEFGAYVCAGLIDFGDMVYTHKIHELAIAMAYAMQGEKRPIEAIIPMVVAYHRENPLNELELNVLFDLACIRLCLTLTNGAYRKAQSQVNIYVSEREKAAWEMLQTLKNIPVAYVESRFRHACGLPLNGDTEATSKWLTDNRAEFSLPVDLNLDKEHYLTFDLSPSSEELIGVDWEDESEVKQHLYNRIRSEKAKFGITRYNEARLAVLNFQQEKTAELDDCFSNVTLGIEFMSTDEGAVLAVLDGYVQSIHHNAADHGGPGTVIIKHDAAPGICFYTIYRNVLTSLKVNDFIEKGKTIGTMAAAGQNVFQFKFQFASDLLGLAVRLPTTCSPDEIQRSFWTTLLPDPWTVLRQIDSCKNTDPYSLGDIIEKRHKFLGKNQKYYYKKPINIVRSRAQYFYDDKGKKYLDSLNNVTHVGHCHPRVTEAITKQAQLLNTNSRLVYEGIVRYAERLVATLPEPLSVCYFVCTGSEANDLALRLARHYTGQHDMLILDGAYHGNTTAVEQISPNRFDGPGGKGAKSFIHKVPQPNLYRGQYRYNDDSAGLKYGQEVEQIITGLSEQGKGIAGFIAESLMGTAGQLVLPDGFLKVAFEHVRKAGGLCISDEVQVGFGRVGKKFWCFETQDVVPDIVVMGKPIANGFPMAMVVTTPEVAESYNTGMKYFNTFGGNPVACAAGLAVLDVIEEEGLQGHALEVGDYFMKGLEWLRKEHKLVGDVRGMGLYLGIEFVRDLETKEPADKETYYITGRLKDKGIISYPNGSHNNCIKIKPPMVFSDQDVDFYINTLDGILNEGIFKLG